MRADVELFGCDIMVGNAMRADAAANGELILVEGCECALQMVALRLFVYLGTLFYNVDEGSLLLDWVREESTPTTRRGLLAEIEFRVNHDPHVQTGTAKAGILKWDYQSVDLNLDLVLIDQDHPDNLQFRVGLAVGEPLLEIIRHGKYRADTGP